MGKDVVTGVRVERWSPGEQEFAVLSARERHVVELFFTLRDLAQVAKELDLGIERVREIVTRVVERWRAQGLGPPRGDGALS